MPVMRKLSALFCLVLLGMLHGNAQFLSVFPGDANANGGCSHADLLQIGQSYQFTDLRAMHRTSFGVPTLPKAGSETPAVSTQHTLIATATDWSIGLMPWPLRPISGNRLVPCSPTTIRSDQAILLNSASTSSKTRFLCKEPRF